MSWLKRWLGGGEQATNGAPGTPIEAQVRAPVHAPAGVDARYARAAALVEAEDYEAALRELESLREDAPELPQVHFSQGYVLRHTGRIGAAIDAYSRALALRPHH